MSLVNPFIHGRALTAAEFIGRASTVRRLASRLETGQSVAVVGQPHLGKTSLLNYLVTDSLKRAREQPRAFTDVFSYLDVHGLNDIERPSRFWELALAPLASLPPVLAAADAERIADGLRLARDDHFRSSALEALFDRLTAARIRLVLLLDEFDVCLTQPALNTPDFYGCLRSLASRARSLVVVLAARRDLEQLNELTQAVNPHGSPYFNVFTQLVLGPLSEVELSALLDRAGERFDACDRAFVSRVSGRHPYLAQTGAAALWDAVEDGLTGTERYLTAGHGLYRQAKHHFADTWKGWSNATRKAVTAVALAETPRLLSQHAFDVDALRRDADDYVTELFTVQEMGLVQVDEPGHWTVAQGAFLWWLADEIRRSVRDETDFRSWLSAQEMEGVLTNEQQQRLATAARSMMAALGKGATTLIETLAKGVVASALAGPK